MPATFFYEYTPLIKDCERTFEPPDPFVEGDDDYVFRDPVTGEAIPALGPARRGLLPNVKMFSDTIKDATAQSVHAVVKPAGPDGAKARLAA